MKTRVLQAITPITAALAAIGIALVAAMGVTAASAAPVHRAPVGCTEVVIKPSHIKPGNGTQAINFHYYCGQGVPNEVITCPVPKWAGPGSTVYTRGCTVRKR